MGILVALPPPVGFNLVGDERVVSQNVDPTKRSFNHNVPG